jgi:protocatechuate 3,4-dioxygenase beta subunit
LLLGTLALGLLPCPRLFAQRITGDIVGTVTDTTGAVVPGAHLTLKDMQRGRELVVLAEKDGSYSFLELPPGLYELRCEHPGFEQQRISNIKLTVEQRAIENITLGVGAVSTTVEVS